MDDRKMEIIQQLMQELQSEMEPDKMDFASRLGREEEMKPEVEISLEGEMPMGDEGMDGEDMESPEDKLKKRLMSLRG